MKARVAGLVAKTAAGLPHLAVADVREDITARLLASSPGHGRDGNHEVYVMSADGRW